MKNLKKIRGDASFREFYRKKNKNYSSIIVYAKKEKNKNLLVYDAINKILIKNKILAPKLYQQSYKKNFIEIQDFGNETIYKVLNNDKNKKNTYFKKILGILVKIQAIKDISIKNFNKKKYIIPKYDNKILISEANLFCDWYIKKKFTKKKGEIFEKKFKKIIKNLTQSLQQKNNVFVHRDFHVSNLMLNKNEIGVIDTQDALIGNSAYDLASLIDDVRFQTSNKFKKKIFNYFVRNKKKVSLIKFKNDFEILSILRNLKIIGIFTRLAIRDSKKKYLKLIPYAWNLIKLRIDENEVFKDLKNLLNQNFKKDLNDY
tara:strand:+ start:1750 stop:2697 length:948 start_codon:yes stop_codon:yes gene_type:complete